MLKFIYFSIFTKKSIVNSCKIKIYNNINIAYAILNGAVCLFTAVR